LQDGPKRQGRFLKKGSSVLRNVSLVDFKFQEMSTPNSLTHDNSKRSIIHVNSHDKGILDASLRRHDKMERDLIPPEERPPIITPVDFTADWEKERSLRKRKIARFEDDDEYEFEIESLNRESYTKIDPSSPDSSNDKMTTSTASSGEKQSILDQNPKGTTTWETMEAVGKAINNLQSKEPTRPISLGEIPPESRKDDSVANLAEPYPLTASKDIFSEQTTKSRDESSQDFTSVSPQHEEAALRNYQKQQQELAKMKQDFEAELSLVLAQEKARAYKDGFQLGEEKAEQQGRERVQELFKNISQLVNDLTQLKFSILNNVQENFYTICQAIGEALVKREFSIHPETFAEVLRSAIAETVQPTNLKILVHPEMYDKLMSLNLHDIRDYLAKDPTLETSGFRLESHLSVIDGSISDMIGKMLKQADLDIFERQIEAPVSNEEKKSA
jgi:flagellar biosynthesis/type III secretory pathway protein FliH